MKGKKVDSEFVSQFINECVSNNILSLEDIVARARNRIDIIDEKIKETEKLKIERSKLIDVIYSFQKSDNLQKIEESKLLPFFKIKNHDICRYICKLVNEKPIELTVITDGLYKNTDIIFCIKQLVENNILEKNGHFFSKGLKFEEYCDTVLKD